MADVIERVQSGELRLMSGECYGEAKCSIVWRVADEAELLRLARLGRAAEKNVIDSCMRKNKELLGFNCYFGATCNSLDMCETICRERSGASGR